MRQAVKVKELIKRYGHHTVLNGLNFEVNQGEIFALLGVNGAGKTTTLECMEGLRSYDSAQIHIHGKIGIQLQSASLPEHILTKEAIQLFAYWNKVTVKPIMLQALGIHDFYKKSYYQLSTGQKRRLHLALALLGNPDIIFLDEPTAGLDVEGRIALHNYIRQLKKEGKTIILSSHDMAEVESLCDRIAILTDGKIVFTGSVEQLNSSVGKHYDISIQTNEGIDTFESDDIVNFLLTILTQYKEKGTTILDLQINRGSLEQHFMKIAKGDKS